jgi:ubiquinone biosynthesis protein UbiJ
VPAYRINQFFKKTKSWFVYAEQSCAKDINEYIHEEAKWLPAREALQDLFDDIDDLRMDVDRLEARIKHLKI